MVCSCIIGDGFPIMILGYTGYTVISATHHLQCHIRINFCFYICKIQQKTFKQVAKGSTSTQKKRPQNYDQQLLTKRFFYPLKKQNHQQQRRTAPGHTNLVLCAKGMACAIRALVTSNLGPNSSPTPAGPGELRPKKAAL